MSHARGVWVENPNRSGFDHAGGPLVRVEEDGVTVGVSRTEGGPLLYRAGEPWWVRWAPALVAVGVVGVAVAVRKVRGG